MNGVEVHGYAIVSDDDCIADAGGAMPRALHNEADWDYFQRGLDLADFVALGRTSHVATPNAKGRRRLILSRQAAGLEQRPDGWWWNPLAKPWREVAGILLPEGGRVAAPGGQAAFDLFLREGYTAFHLSRAIGVALPGGRKIFSACLEGASADEALRRAGLRAGPTQTIDPAAPVTLTVWSA